MLFLVFLYLFSFPQRRATHSFLPVHSLCFEHDQTILSDLFSSFRQWLYWTPNVWTKNENFRVLSKDRLII